jgi:hypothetical protein
MRASLLAEAGQVARVLEVLLKRADFDPKVVSDLVKELAKKEQSELQRGYGRIEPRRRFKPHVSHPLLEQRPRSLLFVDESGKSSSEPPALTRPPVFVLGGIAMAEEAVDDYRVAADEIKQHFFGRRNITFHEPLMRNREGPYYFNGNVRRQAEFDEAVDELVEETKFVAFGVGVRKEAFVRDFVETGVDPYLPTDVYALAIVMLLERYVDYLSSMVTKRLGRVTFESQGPLEDAYHQLEYARTFIDGSQWVPDSAFRSWLETGLRFTAKSGSDPMELADMLSRDLFEWVRSECTASPKRWDLLSKKIHCRGDGRMGKFGVKVFPDSDIREHVEAHRARCGATT